MNYRQQKYRKESNPPSLWSLNWKLSTINYPLSIIHYQLSTIHYQLSIILRLMCVSACHRTRCLASGLGMVAAGRGWLRAACSLLLTQHDSVMIGCQNTTLRWLAVKAQLCDDWLSKHDSAMIDYQNTTLWWLAVTTACAAWQCQGQGVNKNTLTASSQSAARKLLENTITIPLMDAYQCSGNKQRDLLSPLSWILTLRQLP